MPDGNRRVHPRVPGDRRGRLHPFASCGGGALSSGQYSRRTAIHAPDNGPELVSHAILEWISQAGIATALSDPGKPWQNGADESLNGKLRDECLSLEWFRSRKETAVIIEAWRYHYNTVRPDSSLDYLTSHEFKRHRMHNPPIPNRAVLQE